MKRLIVVFAVLVAALAFAGCNRQQAGGDAVQLTVELFDRGTDGGKTQADDNAWTHWIQEKVKKDLNIDLTFMLVPRWEEDTAIVNLMASGSAPDLCLTYNSGMITSFRDQGGIMDLAPFIDRLLPDVKRQLGPDPAVPGMDFIYRYQEPDTGRIYRIPKYNVHLAQRNIFIRKDWLDTLGLPLPKTTQEYHDALAAFRDRDPGNVGRNNVIPFATSSDARWGFASIVHAYFDLSISERELWVTRFSDRPVTVPGFKDGLRMINDWYNEGLILRDFPVMRNSDDYYNMIKSGIVGSFSGDWDIIYRPDYKLILDMRQTIPGADFVPVDCIQSSDGLTHKDIRDKPNMSIFIPSSAKNHEAALRYLNWLSIYENFHFLQVGEAGVNHEIVNGVPKNLTPPPGHPWTQNSVNNLDLTYAMNGVEMNSQELNARTMALSYDGFPSAVIENAYNMALLNGRAPPVYQATTTLDGVYGQVLRDKADVLIALAATARPGEFDRVWEEGMRDYLSSGAQEVMDERASLWK